MPGHLTNPPPICSFTATGPIGLDCILHQTGRELATIRLAGELDIATAPRLRQAVREIEPRPKPVVLDLRRVTFLDSCGLHAIVDASEELRHAGHRLVLVRGASHVDRLFDLTGASDALEIVDLTPGEPPVQALLALARHECAA